MGQVGSFEADRLILSERLMARSVQSARLRGDDIGACEAIARHLALVDRIGSPEQKRAVDERLNRLRHRALERLRDRQRELDAQYRRDVGKLMAWSKAMGRRQARVLVPMAERRTREHGRPQRTPARRRSSISRDDGDSGPGESAKVVRLKRPTYSTPLAIAASLRRKTNEYVFSFHRLRAEIREWGYEPTQRVPGMRSIEMEVMDILGRDWWMGAESIWETEHPGQYLPKARKVPA